MSQNPSGEKQQVSVTGITQPSWKALGTIVMMLSRETRSQNSEGEVKYYCRTNSRMTSRSVPLSHVEVSVWNSTNIEMSDNTPSPAHVESKRSHRATWRSKGPNAGVALRCLMILHDACGWHRFVSKEIVETKNGPGFSSQFDYLSA